MTDEVFAWTAVQQPGVSRRAALGRAERDLDLPVRRAAEHPDSDDTWLASMPAGRSCAWATST